MFIEKARALMADNYQVTTNIHFVKFPNDNGIPYCEANTVSFLVSLSFTFVHTYLTRSVYYYHFAGDE